eukprot:gnl/MRDRNA2_/MRDRNA2_77991_c0_seq1.p1 gnl/MRDRNA2_/MRDRNA2_77991_c0~~gnl/MRDRNA2_/MRDRNA2_77991_c0_seq1.p1  ORF type:complete len:886 (+),score=148.74 gnl/MRDRNA2_/MRDRNA2_77991_c0_seq1:235-2658(+)
MVTDYDKSSNFRTVDEVLFPAVNRLGGYNKFVKLKDLLEDMNFKLDFQALVGSIWDPQDFMSYFRGHSETWAFDDATQMLRLRDEQEKSAYKLIRGDNIEELVNKFEAQAFSWLPLDVISHLLRTCAKPLPSDPSGLAKVVRQLGVRKLEPEAFRKKYIACGTKPLRVLKTALSGLANQGLTDGEKIPMTLPSMVPLCIELEKFGRYQMSPETKKEHMEAFKLIKELICKMIEAKESKLNVQCLGQLMEIELDWEVYGSLLSSKAQQIVNMESLEELVPLIRKIPKKASALGECVATAILMKTFGAPPATSVEALEAMAASGFGFDGVAMTLKMIFMKAPFEACARVVARLGEHGFQGGDFEELCQLIASYKNNDDESSTELHGMLKTVSPSVLVQLAMAASKSTVLASSLFAAVCSVMSSQMTSDSWPPDELARCLQGLSEASAAGLSNTESADLLNRIPAVLTRKLAIVTSAQLLGIVSTLSKVSSRDESYLAVLKAAAAQCVNRVSDLLPSQLAQVTKDLLSLGVDNPSLLQILDYWEQSLKTSKSEALVARDPVSSRRLELEKKEELTADEVAHLAELLAPVAPKHGIFEVLSKRLLDQLHELTIAGMASVEAAFNKENGLNFPSRSQLLKAVTDAQKCKEDAQKCNEDVQKSDLMGDEHSNGKQWDPPTHQDSDPALPQSRDSRDPDLNQHSDPVFRQPKKRSDDVFRLLDGPDSRQQHRDRSPRQLRQGRYRDRSPWQERDYSSRSGGHSRGSSLQQRDRSEERYKGQAQRYQGQAERYRDRDRSRSRDRYQSGSSLRHRR